MYGDTLGQRSRWCGQWACISSEDLPPHVVSLPSTNPIPSHRLWCEEYSEARTLSGRYIWARWDGEMGRIWQTKSVLLCDEVSMKWMLSLVIIYLLAWSLPFRQRMVSSLTVHWLSYLMLLSCLGLQEVFLLYLKQGQPDSRQRPWGIRGLCSLFDWRLSVVSLSLLIR